MNSRGQQRSSQAGNEELAGAQAQDKTCKIAKACRTEVQSTSCLAQVDMLPAASMALHLFDTESTNWQAAMSPAAPESPSLVHLPSAPVFLQTGCSRRGPSLAVAAA